MKNTEKAWKKVKAVKRESKTVLGNVELNEYKISIYNTQKVGITVHFMFGVELLLLLLIFLEK